jgi:hypothetical protein
VVPALVVAAGRHKRLIQLPPLLLDGPLLLLLLLLLLLSLSLLAMMLVQEQLGLPLGGQVLASGSLPTHRQG